MKEIIVNGKVLPIHFGLKAINEFTKLQNGDFHDTVTTTNSLGNLDSIVTLAVSGLNEGARRSKSDIRYTENEVWDLFDENPKLILEVSEIFMEAVIPLTDKLGTLNPNGQPTATEGKSE
ncbi:hypothetical protein [Bacteroides sp.]|uniref:hypothetical protein n=1 Tax=Bacteroides sp. TaxID=29523 RepID=UPI00261161C1|nr:hypothetical protein [Bacteroides sp.]MDD3039481.1 hypothetical protein [Bacteroides sp.]